MTAVVAAIDFGTYGTGYAWTEVTENADGTLTPLRREPTYRDSWGTGRYYPKDLTAVMLGADGEIIAYGHEARKEWARQSVNGAVHGYASGFKMALKADAYQGLEAPGFGTVKIDSVAKAYPLVVAFLRYMYQTALREIQVSGAYPENRIRWCLTVPAIWDDAEKQLMRDAASEAGLPSGRDRLILVLEPEAAAVYCQAHLAHVLSADRSQRRQLIEPGTRFMVVDCGGGTVDITAFRVVSDAYGRDRMIEIGKVSGGKLGSEYINEEFVKKVLHDRFEGPEVVDRIRRECPHALLELMERWESHKVDVRVRRRENRLPVLERHIYLSIPGEIEDLLSETARDRLAAQPGGNPHRIVVAPEEAMALFDKVVVEIMEHVSGQLTEIGKQDGRRDGPERLLLVGGLANSAYLQEYLHAMFRGKAEILVPANPAAAVLFGAVLYGCDAAVIARRARYTFGFGILRPFERGLDDHRPERDRFTDQRGALWCRNRFQAFVTNGETIKADQRMSKIVYPLHEEASLTLSFYRTLELEPRYIDEPGCERIGSLTIQFGEAMRRPVDERAVEVQIWFGDTDIFATAINVHTKEQVETILRFGPVDRELRSEGGAQQ